MPSRHLIGALLVAVALASGSLLVQAQTSGADARCTAALDELDRKTEAFVQELKKENVTFIKTDIRETALSGIRKHFAGNPTSGAVFDLRDKWGQWTEWKDFAIGARVTLDDLLSCMNTKGCPMTEFVKRQHEAIAKWIQSWQDEGLNAATERVKKAASLIQSYVDNALNMATGSALRTVEDCSKAEIDRRAQTQNPTRTADGRQSPPQGTPGAGGTGGGAAPPIPAGDAPAAQPPKGGGGSDAALWGSLAAAGGLAFLFKDQLSGGGGNDCGPQPSITPPSGQSRPTDAQLDKLRVWCTCQKRGFGQGPNGFGCL